MTEVNNIREFDELLQAGNHVYFIGIGGIGMSALARYFNSLGMHVSGYDKTPSALTADMQAEGINVHFTDDPTLADQAASFVVYTPAIPSSHREYNALKKLDVPMYKRSEVLGLITSRLTNICVAGTHGKTTTSAMIAHIMRDSGIASTAFLGGIAANYETNFWSTGTNICVAEADEYDRSFLKLHPDVAIITAMDPDHLDIYGTAVQMENAFIEFTGNIKSGGILIYKHGLKRAGEFRVSNRMSYAATDHHADVFATNIDIVEGSYHFTISLKGHHHPGFVLHMGGMHNIENAIAAIAAAHEAGVEMDSIRKAVESFRGVKRRFEYIVRTADTVMIDDYAHHPEELRALITGAKALYPDRKATVIFQPHLFSRTRDLAAGFADALSLADELVLLPIYPAREEPIPGVTSNMILEGMTSKGGQVMEKEELLAWISGRHNELLISSGAGDIDLLVQPIKEILLKQQ